MQPGSGGNEQFWWLVPPGKTLCPLTDEGKGSPLLLAVLTQSEMSIRLNLGKERREWVAAQVLQILAVLTEI